MNIFSFYVLVFTFYAVFGWFLEVLCGFYQHKTFINRGFLIGPYCPIYGFGCVLLTLIFKNYTNNIYIVFFGTIVVCSVLEYFTSYFMEKIFHARWWDYSDKFLNIQGRICFLAMSFFGIMGTLSLYFINPKLFSLIEKLPPLILNITGIILFLIFIVDTIISFNVFQKIKASIKKESKDNTREITLKVRELISSKSLLFKRVVKAFPDFKTQLKQIRNIRKSK